MLKTILYILLAVIAVILVLVLIALVKTLTTPVKTSPWMPKSEKLCGETLSHGSI